MPVGEYTSVTTPSASDQALPIESRSGLDPWRTAHLPAPPDTRGLKIFSIIGPGAILLGASIGSGEWLLGPATFVKYGMSLLWITLVAVFLQTVLNTEFIRYTLYTGEPAFTGFMRTRPHAAFWALFYAVCFFFQTGWPGWAGTGAGAIFYLFNGRVVTAGDAGAVYQIGAGTFLLCVFILVFSGKRIERTLEILNWIMIACILGGLSVLCVLFTGPRTWVSAVTGFAGFDWPSGRFNFIPEGADWFLLGAFAAYSGSGGVINITVANWVRDKGYGMGQVVGFIPAAVGGQKVKLAHTGSIFEVTRERLLSWRGWWRIVQLDQWSVFFVGALLGMVFPAMLYTANLPAGREIRGPAVATELAGAMRVHGAAVTYFLALMGVWVLIKTQLDIMEGMVRAITDILWSGSRRVRRWTGDDVRLVYYSVLGSVVVWGLIALRLTPPIILLQLGANVAGFVCFFSALHILRVNTTLLPEPLRPPLWRRVALIAAAVFYAFFVYLWLMGGIIPDPAKGFLFNLPKYLGGG